MLGKKYYIQNFGVSGATMLKKGNKPYWNQLEYQQTLVFNPKIIVLMLGTNDSKPINLDTYKNEFAKDYNEIIPNNIHPNADGAKQMAIVVVSRIIN